MRRLAMMRLSRRGFAGVGMAGAAVLAGCRNRSGSSGSAGRGATAATPSYGGTLTVPVSTDFYDFDPSTLGKSVPNPYATLIGYETLLDFQRGQNVAFDQIDLTPKLAESWETSDAQTYTFHLRKDVKFADLPPVNGRGLTSADVKWSFEYYARAGQFAGKDLPPPSSTSSLNGLDRVDTPDPYTVVVRFKQPFAPFVNYSVTQFLLIMPHEIFDQDGTLSKRMVGSGPFQFDESSTQRGSRWVFKKNPAYWQTGRPFIDAIHYLVLKDSASTLAAFQAKQIDILGIQTEILGATAINNAKEYTGGAVVQNFVDPGPYGCYITCRRAPFNDQRMRQAVLYGIDKDEFDRVVGGGQGVWPMLGPTSWWTQDEVKKMTPYDPARSKQLMAAAGYPNGVDAEYLMYNPNPPTEELFQSQMKKIGINLTIKQVDSATGSSRLHSGDFTFIGNRLNYQSDLDSRFVGEYYSRAAGGDYVGQKDDKLDNLIEAERREVDATKRLDLLKQTAAYATETAFNPGWFAVYAAAYWQPSVHNFWPNLQQDDWNGRNIWLSK